MDRKVLLQILRMYGVNGKLLKDSFMLEIEHVLE